MWNPFSPRPLRALFVGNSLTYYRKRLAGADVVLNDLPGLLGRMAAGRGGRPFRAALLAEDAASLKEHWESGRFAAALAGGRWDFVVLQTHSAACAEEEGAAAALRERCARAGARSVLLKPQPPAWQECRRLRPELPLSMKDGLHPGPLGSYLTACALFGLLYGKSPVSGGPGAWEDDARAVGGLSEAHAAVEGPGERPWTREDLAFLRSLVEPAVIGGGSGPAERARV